MGSVQMNDSYICPECMSEVEYSEKYCPDCGCPIEYIKPNREHKYVEDWVCPECFSIVKSNETFCTECGCPIEIIKGRQSEISKEAIKLKADKTCDYPLKTLLSIYDSIIIFDIETTGLNCSNDRIIELSAIKVTGYKESFNIESKMDNFISLPDDMKLSDRITEITGIKNSDLLKYGFPAKQVFKKFIKMFEDKETLLVAYNAQFDLCFLSSSFRREGLDNILSKADYLDALTVFKDRRSYPHKLKDAISAYNLDNEVKNTHKSIDDTDALLEVLKAMDDECKDLDKYINIFGYNPKYGIQGFHISKIRYIPQPYNNYKKLYQ